MATTFYGKKNNAKTTITNNPLTAGGLSITLASSTGSKFPTGTFLVTIWDAATYSDPGDDAQMEIVLCDSRSGDTVTVNASGRGYGGTSAVQHATGSAFRLFIMKEHADQWETAINALETSMALIVGASPLVLSATPWTNVLTLSGVGTTADTDIDLTANTSAAATHVILKVRVENTATTEGSFITFRAKGATASDLYWRKFFAPQVSGFHNEAEIIVPMDSEQRITYNINSTAGAMSVNAWVIGYFKAVVS